MTSVTLRHCRYAGAIAGIGDHVADGDNVARISRSRVGNPGDVRVDDWIIVGRTGGRDRHQLRRGGHAVGDGDVVRHRQRVAGIEEIEVLVWNTEGPVDAAVPGAGGIVQARGQRRL